MNVAPLFQEEEKNKRERKKRGEKEGKKGVKEEKRQKTKNRGMVDKKNGKQKKMTLPFQFLGSFFKSGMGSLSNSVEQYTSLLRILLC